MAPDQNDSVERESFWYLVDLIKTDPIFHTGTPLKPQRPVMYQLATFLALVGAEPAIKTAAIMAIAEGSVHLYNHRVVQAFRRLRSQHLAWPGLERRAYISAKMEEQWGFRHCIGIADGSYVFLDKKPTINGYAYWCRKKRYAVSRH
jgi:hypothetical protein